MNTDTHDLTILSFPPSRKVAVIKAVRELTDLGSKEAKDAVENLPYLVMKYESEGESHSAQDKLKAAGATVRLELVDAVEDEGDASAAASSDTDMENRLFAIAARVAVYTHAAEHLDNDEVPHARKEMTAALPVALGEIHTDLMNIVNQLADERMEKRAVES
jgi:Ribosomal protein L7/L12 C-terminal domain